MPNDAHRPGELLYSKHPPFLNTKIVWIQVQYCTLVSTLCWGVSIGFFEIRAINSLRSNNWMAGPEEMLEKYFWGIFWWNHKADRWLCVGEGISPPFQQFPPPSSRSSYWCSPWLCQHWQSSVQQTVVCYIKRERGRWVKVAKRRRNVEDETFTFYSWGRLFWKNLDFAG